MRIGLQTWGSDGDIRPFCALAGGLREAGHEVTLGITSVDNKEYASLGEALGFKVIDTGPILVGNVVAIAARILRARDPARQIKILFNEVFLPDIGKISALSIKLCEENQVVIGHHILYPLMGAAQKYNRSHGTVTFCHGMIPTSFIPPGALPDLGQLSNALLWRLTSFVIDWNLKPQVNKLRRSMGVEPQDHVFGEGWLSQKLNMIAVGKALCQHREKWGDHHKVCGFFNVPERGEPYEMPEDLALFFNAPEKPIYMTFGSMTQFGLEEQTRLMVNAATLAGVRAIIQSDWDLLPPIETGDSIYKIGKAPHDQLFGRCALVVHHGGSGTTQASVRAGVPSVVAAHGFDQPFWGEELKRIGVAGKVLHRRSLNAKKLARAIGRVIDSKTMKQKTQMAGVRMREEDGVGNAVRWIKELLI